MHRTCQLPVPCNCTGRIPNPTIPSCSVPWSRSSCHRYRSGTDLQPGPFADYAPFCWTMVRSYPNRRKILRENSHVSRQKIPLSPMTSLFKSLQSKQHTTCRCPYGRGRAGWALPAKLPMNQLPDIRASRPAGCGRKKAPAKCRSCHAGAHRSRTSPPHKSACDGPGAVSRADIDFTSPAPGAAYACAGRSTCGHRHASCLLPAVSGHCMIVIFLTISQRGNRYNVDLSGAVRIVFRFARNRQHQWPD